MNTAKNTTARKTASQRAQEKVLNGHDQSAQDAHVKGEATGTQYAYQAYCEALGVKTDTPAITFTNCIAGFLGSIVAMVFGYAVGMTIVDLLAYGVFLLTGWAYLALAVYIVGMVFTAVAAIYTAGKVAAYIGTGQYSKDMEKAGAWIKSKFSFGKSEKVAA